MAVQHVQLLERKHYVARCWASLQDRFAALDSPQQQLVRECVASAVETAIEAFLQGLQEARAAIRFNGGDELVLEEVDNLVAKVFDRCPAAE
jgi:hypothetical protein